MREPVLVLLLVSACSSHPPALQDSHGVSGGSGGSGTGGGAGAPQGQTTNADTTRYAEGEQLDPSLSWQGYAAGSDTLGKVSLADYQDPDGSRGVNALLIEEDSVTCPACKVMSGELPGRLAGGWAAEGVAILQLVILDANLKWAGPEAALAWKQAFGASWAVGADPTFTFSRAGKNTLPVQVLIDPRTLTLVHRSFGYQSSYPELDDLVAKNAH